MSTPRKTLTGPTGVDPYPFGGCHHLSADRPVVASPARHGACGGAVGIARRGHARRAGTAAVRRAVAVPAGRAGRVGAMTGPAERARNVRAPQAPTLKPKAPATRDTGPDVAGHGLLSRFHTGCRCGWCSSRARETTCGCAPCLAYRAHPYVVLPAGRQP